MKVSICLRIKFICFVFLNKLFTLIGGNLSGYFCNDIIKLFNVLLCLWVNNLSIRFNLKKVLSFGLVLSENFVAF